MDMGQNFLKTPPVWAYQGNAMGINGSAS